MSLALIALESGNVLDRIALDEENVLGYETGIARDIVDSLGRKMPGLADAELYDLVNPWSNGYLQISEELPIVSSAHIFTCLNPLHYGPCRHAHPHLLGHVEAMAMQDRMLARKPWTADQQEGLEKYADGAAWQMNDLLRGKPNDLIDDRTHAWVKGAAQGMRPLPQAVSAFRGVGLEAFGVSSVDDLRGLQGRTVQEPGFLSTSIDPDQAFPGKVHLELEVPAGTPAAYLEGLNPAGEFELLLGPGRRIMIGDVEVKGDTAIVKTTVVG